MVDLYAHPTKLFRGYIMLVAACSHSACNDVRAVGRHRQGNGAAVVVTGPMPKMLARLRGVRFALFPFNSDGSAFYIGRT